MAAAAAAAAAAAEAEAEADADGALELVDDGWSGTRLVRLRRASPGAVHLVDDAVPAGLAREVEEHTLTLAPTLTLTLTLTPTPTNPNPNPNQVYEHTLVAGHSWGTYVTLAEAQAGGRPYPYP